jgi:TPR repeat protein
MSLRCPDLGPVASLLIVVLAIASIAADEPEPSALDPGIASYKAGDWKTAMAELTPLAEEGDAVAQFYVGFMFETGKGVETDPEQAIGWYKASAEQQNARAQFNLAAAYESGRGTEKDLAESHRWYLASAESDFERAQYKVAQLFEAGSGIYEPDLVQAHKWFALAGKDRYRDARKQKRRVAKLMDPYDIAEAELQARLWRQAQD